MQAYKFNEEKTLIWLQKKVERVAEVLKQKGVHVSQGATSATYVRSTKFENVSEIGKNQNEFHVFQNLKLIILLILYLTNHTQKICFIIFSMDTANSRYCDWNSVDIITIYK